LFKLAPVVGFAKELDELRRALLGVDSQHFKERRASVRRQLQAMKMRHAVQTMQRFGL
jgi:hypothetical protein